MKIEKILKWAGALGAILVAANYISDGVKSVKNRWEQDVVRTSDEIYDEIDKSNLKEDAQEVADILEQEIEEMDDDEDEDGETEE